MEQYWSEKHTKTVKETAHNLGTIMESSQVKSRLFI